MTVLWIIGVIVLVKALKYGGACAPRGRRRFRDFVRAEGWRYGVDVPHERELRHELRAIYARREHVTPAVKAEVDAVIDSMWQELRYATSYGEWRRILRQVRNGLDEVVRGGGDPLADSLSRLKRSSAQWRDARAEAFG